MPPEQMPIGSSANPYPTEDAAPVSGLTQRSVPGGGPMLEGGQVQQPQSAFDVGQSRTEMNIPSFLSFDRVFANSYPDAPAPLQESSRTLLSYLDQLFRQPGQSGGGIPKYEMESFSYRYTDYLRDLAVMMAARQGWSQQQADTGTQRPSTGRRNFTQNEGGSTEPGYKEPQSSGVARKQQ